MNTKEALDYLGYNGEDKVTEFKGVVASITFDLYGCVQVILTPKHKEGKKYSQAFDISRITLDKSERVMPIPPAYLDAKADVSTHGPAEKPPFTK